MTTDNPNQDIFDFLDNLRESGQINMFGAAPVIQDVFDLSRRESQSVLQEWMNNFQCLTFFALADILKEFC